MTKTEFDLKLEELIAQAIELEIITKEDDSSPFMFEDDILGKTEAAVAKFLRVDKEMFARISELVNEDEDLDDSDDDSDDE